MILLILLPLLLAIAGVLFLELRRHRRSPDPALFAQAAERAAAQFRAGAVPDIRCPACAGAVAVEVDRSASLIGVLRVRCPCRAMDAEVPV